MNELLRQQCRRDVGEKTHLALNNVFVDIDHFQSTFLFAYPLTPKLVGFLCQYLWIKFVVGIIIRDRQGLCGLLGVLVDWHYSLASAGAFCYCACATPRGHKSLILYEMSQSAFLIKFAVEKNAVPTSWNPPPPQETHRWHRYHYIIFSLFIFVLQVKP